MTEVLQTIKRAALDAVEDAVPAVPLVGTVVGVDPLSVRLDQRLTLSARRLLVLDGMDGLGDAVSAGGCGLYRYQGS